MTNNCPHNANGTTSMALPTAPSASMGTGPSKKLDINSLMSPPDVVLDSFTHSESGYSSVAPGQASSKHPMPMSPPISPYNKPMSSIETPVAPVQMVKDPVLYPAEDNTPAPLEDQPMSLFAPVIPEDHQRIIDEHVRQQSQEPFAKTQRPKNEDYNLTLTFKSQFMKAYLQDPRGWLRRERAYLLKDRKHSMEEKQKNFVKIQPAPKAASKPRTQRTDRVTKPQAAPRAIRSNPGVVSHPGPSRPAQPRHGRPTPEPARKIVSPNREDKDFNSIVNYCPPLDSLPNRPNCLKVDWKGQPLDLSKDPLLHLLHREEVNLASTLRLDCATYLTSKRRIFERRLVCLRNGKEFRKTDAQQACKIDVNKASKLWAIFDKVGWLNAEWVRQFQ